MKPFPSWEKLKIWLYNSWGKWTLPTLSRGCCPPSSKAKTSLAATIGNEAACRFGMMPVFEYGISSQFQYLQYANFQIELRNHPWHKVGNSLKPSLQRLVLQVIIFKKLGSYYVFNCFHLARHGVASLNASLQLKEETSHIGKSFQMHDDSWHNHCLMTGTFVPVSCCGVACSGLHKWLHLNGSWNWLGLSSAGSSLNWF